MRIRRATRPARAIGACLSLELARTVHPPCRISQKGCSQHAAYCEQHSARGQSAPGPGTPGAGGAGKSPPRATKHKQQASPAPSAAAAKRVAQRACPPGALASRKSRHTHTHTRTHRQQKRKRRKSQGQGPRQNGARRLAGSADYQAATLSWKDLGSREAAKLRSCKATATLLPTCHLPPAMALTPSSSTLPLIPSFGHLAPRRTGCIKAHAFPAFHLFSFFLQQAFSIELSYPL